MRELGARRFMIRMSFRESGRDSLRALENTCESVKKFVGVGALADVV